MRTRKFKTMRRWLEYISRHNKRSREEVYEPLNEFFAESSHVMYFVNFGEPDERFVNEWVVLPWTEKLAVAQAIVDFHWRSRTKAERLRIAEALAKGKGDLSFLQSFMLSMLKTNGRWAYNYCTCGLSGPNYDWCKRKYLRSI